MKTNPNNTSRLQSTGLVPALILAIVTIIMLLTIAQYSGGKNDVGFLRYKQDYLSNPTWKAAFYIHVFSCFLCLLAGFTQFSNSILLKARNLHKWMGRVYAYNILLINFPAGMILAIYANGHLPSKIAFVTLDCCWFIFTLKAIMHIKNGDVQKHKEFMTRSYALTLSALTLRLWKQVFLHSSTLDPDMIYRLDAWLGFVPNLLIAEWIIRSGRRNLSLNPDITSNDIKG